MSMTEEAFRLALEAKDKKIYELEVEIERMRLFQTTEANNGRDFKDAILDKVEQFLDKHI